MSTLHTKLAEIMAEVGRIPKRGRNEFHKYDYATEADIVEAVRGALSSRSVTLVPAIKQVLREGTLTTALMTFTFVDGETGEVCEKEWAGTGDDKGDKGLYKAMTGALKYFLLKTFLMPTGDDPEADEGTDKRTAGTADRPKRGKATPATMTPEQRAAIWGGEPQPVPAGSATDGAAAPAPEDCQGCGTPTNNAEGGFCPACVADGRHPTQPAKARGPHYWNSRTHAYMHSLGFVEGDKGKPERRRTYSLALGRAIVTDENSSAISEEEWRQIGKYLKEKNTPPVKVKP